MSSPAPVSDDALARRAAAGDRAALGELVTRYRVRVLGLVRKCGAREPDDVAQEVWAKVTAALPKWRSRHFRGWLFRIARNAAIDADRRRTEGQTEEVVLLTAVAPEADDDWTTELLPRLRKCLALLQAKKPDFHTAVVMQMGGSTLKEIADAQGKAGDLDTVKTRIFRGKQALRKCVGDEP